MKEMSFSTTLPRLILSGVATMQHGITYPWYVMYAPVHGQSQGGRRSSPSSRTPFAPMWGRRRETCSLSATRRARAKVLSILPLSGAKSRLGWHQLESEVRYYGWPGRELACCWRAVPKYLPCEPHRAWSGDATR